MNASPPNRRVFLSLPVPKNLDPRRQRLRTGLIERIRKAGYQPEIFLEEGLAAALAWSMENVSHVMQRCVGIAILAMPRWTFAEGDRRLQLASEFHQYEGAIAFSLGLPLLVTVERGVEERGVLWTSSGPILFLEADDDESWFESERFLRRFGIWKQAMNARSDVFLGYCSKAKDVANAVHLYLSTTLGVSVENWAMDFGPGGIILDKIQRAARNCTCGIFLFTTDDPLEGDTERAAPRDNVVFETGFFASSRGPDHILIIREDGAKMPADLGGNIYVPLRKDRDIGPIQESIRRFVRERVGV